MNESFEKPKTPEHKRYENAINTYPEFLADLEAARDLESIIEAVERNTFVDGGADNEHIFYQVDKSDEESTEVTPFLTDEFVTLLREFIHDQPTEADQIDMKIEHADLNKAVKRVLGIV
jgi:hypothetical protein